MTCLLLASYSTISATVPKQIIAALVKTDFFKIYIYIYIHAPE